jgi:acyl carrier protein
MNGPFDLDSLDALQIALAVKERYKVRIEGGPDGRKAFASLSALADFIIEARSASA